MSQQSNFMQISGMWVLLKIHHLVSLSAAKTRFTQTNLKMIFAHTSCRDVKLQQGGCSCRRRMTPPWAASASPGQLKLVWGRLSKAEQSALRVTSCGWCEEYLVSTESTGHYHFSVCLFLECTKPLAQTIHLTHGIQISIWNIKHSLYYIC